MTNTDPPDHARLRKLANRAFTARRVEALRDGVQRIVDRLIDEAVAAGPAMDLIEAVASPLPMSVVCELFGIPEEDRPQVKSWFRRFGLPARTSTSPRRRSTSTRSTCPGSSGSAGANRATT